MVALDKAADGGRVFFAAEVAHEANDGRSPLVGVGGGEHHSQAAGDRVTGQPSQVP